MKKSLSTDSRPLDCSVTSVMCLMTTTLTIVLYRHRHQNHHYPLCTMAADTLTDPIVRTVKVSNISIIVNMVHIIFVIVFDDHWTEDCQYDVVSVLL